MCITNQLINMQFSEKLLSGQHLLSTENIEIGVARAKEKYGESFLYTKKYFFPDLADSYNVAFKILLSTCRYGQIYWMNQEEAQNTVSSEVWSELKEQLEYLDNLICSEVGYIRLINYTIWNRIEKDKQKIPKNTLVPKFGYGGFTNGKPYYNPSQWKEFREQIKSDRVLGDYHDEGHITASLQNLDFESKYYDQENMKGLESLETNYKKQIISRPQSGLDFSDGNIITTITFHPYYENSYKPDSELITQIGHEVAKSLSNKIVAFESVDRNNSNSIEYYEISPNELAVLMQNKMYEGSASMIESNIYTRGGSDGKRGRSHLDKLFNLSPFQRIEFLASQKSNYVSHHQHRNTIRNAGQVYGYLLKAKELLLTPKNTQEIFILREIINQANYLLTGEKTKPINNLFNLIHEQRKIQP
jgi:hypothetical protein